MQELRALVSGGAEDATVIEADSLLQELTGNITGVEGGNIAGVDGATEEPGALEESAEGGVATPPVPDPPTV
jgi:hypothetical protein